jgi:hypothetical protein
MSANGILPRPGGRGTAVPQFIRPRATRVIRAGISYFCAALAFSVSIFLSVPVFAQNDVGSIVGFVSDSSGAAVPNTKVIIKNEGTGESRTVDTDGSTTLPVH